MKAGVTNTKAKNKWHLSGLYLDSCNCDWGCPCQFNAGPTHGNCEGVGGIHIIEGQYGNIKVGGLNMAWMASWPGPIHEGHGKGSLYIDRRANEEQFNALSRILMGKARGGPFVVYGSVMDVMEEPKRANIIFQSKRLRSRVKIDQDDKTVGEAWLEPMTNPVTGKVHRAIIELPEGFEAARMDMSSTKTIMANNALLKFKYAGTYGSFQETIWKGVDKDSSQ
jgi:hypothetical protein